MFRSRLFWKLFLGFTAINLLTTIALLSATWRWQLDRRYEQIESDLKLATELFESQSKGWDFEEDKETVKQYLSTLNEKTGTELACFDPEGKLILQTESFPNSKDILLLAEIALERGEEWLYANPKQRTTESGISLSKNESADGLGQFNAYAKVIESDEKKTLGVICASQAVSSATQELASLWRLYGLLGIVAALLILGIGYGVVTHIVRPVLQLNQSANALTSGDYSQRAFVSNNDELGTLAIAFNEMSMALDNQLTNLRESDRQQATVLGGMTEGVVAVDELQKVLFANTAAGKLFGFLPPEVVGRPLLEVIRKHALHEAAIAVNKADRSQRLELEWEEHQLSVQVTPLVGQPSSGAVIVLHDVTELKRLESLRRDFIANVSHELKTPLSSIKAYTETLIGGASDDPVHGPKFLSRIAEQAERLDELIRDMLNLARIESAQQPFDIKAVNLTELIESVVDEYLPRAKSHNNSLRWHNDEEARRNQLRVKADPGGLRVILSNLLDNAIKYTPEGGAIEVSCNREDQMIELLVTDTGVGIPESKIGRVFERFYRVDAARNREQGGTGLGLSIVKHLSQSFGGSVSVDSVEGQGSTFKVVLPVSEDISVD